MSAPTLWEEGRWSGARVTRLAVLLCTVAVGVDLLIGHRLGWIFGIGFVLICIGAALAVHPRDFYRVAVLPPVLLLGVAIVLSAVDRTAVATRRDAYVQAVVDALAHHAAALMVGYALALAILVIRHQVIERRRYSNRLASPAP